MQCVIFDLDGCISDDRWRRKYMPAPEDWNKPHAWDDYNKKAMMDVPINRNHVTSALRNPECKVLFFTARPERFRANTTQWLRYHFGPWMFNVFHRADDDFRPSPEVKRDMLRSAGVECECTRILAYDDRTAVLDAYLAAGVEECFLLDELGQRKRAPKKGKRRQQDAADILSAAAETYRQRNAAYGSNYQNVAPVIQAMFPDGVPAELVTRTEWHLFELLVVKLTRFANSGMTHNDSIRDAAVYAAMVEAQIGDDK